MRATWVIVGVLGLAGGCGVEVVDESSDEAIQALMGGVKADAADKVAMRGPLAFGQAVVDKLTQDGELHGWTLSVRPGARVTLEVTHKTSTKALDDILFLYGPKKASGYGSKPLVYNKDSGWAKHAKIVDFVLKPGGDYLVVVGAQDGKSRGTYRLLTTCTNGACEPLPAITECHPGVLATVENCVVDVLANPDGEPVDGATAADLCTDAEPLGPAHDAVCASSPAPAFCALSYEAFYLGMAPLCRAAITPLLPDLTCVFGATWHGVTKRPGLFATAASVVTSAAGLGALEKKQIVLAVQASAHTDVTSAAEALSRVDGGVIHRVQLWDETALRAFTAYEYGVGDNSYGRIFESGTTVTAARIQDGDLAECTTLAGPGSRDCTQTSDCDAGLACLGIAEEVGLGKCAALAQRDGEDTFCAQTVDCPQDTGLLCTGAALGNQGLCLPAYMWGAFEDATPVDVPAGAEGAARSIVAYGLTTVDMDVWVALTVRQTVPGALKVTLTNPATAEVVVYAGTPDGDLTLDQAVWGFSGDELVNGAWTLRVTRVGEGGGTVTFDGWTLRISSRWD